MDGNRRYEAEKDGNGEQAIKELAIEDRLIHYDHTVVAPIIEED